ncbi:MAG: hypothetical protein WAV76_07270 [Bacteroidota bacterium]
MPNGTPKLVFNYIKTGNYRSYYANGVFGGLMPKGELQMDFFIERRVIPQTVAYEISKDGHLAKEIEVKGKEGLVREIECGVVMDIEAAQAFHQWLGQKIEELKKIRAAIKA